MLTASPPETRLRFHPLTFLEEGDEVVIGRRDTDVYAVFPEDGAALVKELQAGRPLAAAAEWYQTTFGEPVAMDEFVDTLRELTFLAGPGDDADDPSDGLAAEPSPVRWQRLGRALFSPVGWLAMASFVALALVAALHDPRLLPRRGNVLFTDYLLLVELTVIAGQVPLGLVHEGFHVLAGRRLGLRASVRLSQRFYFVVFETVLDGLVSVPRCKRYLPMLAGMIADLLTMSALTLVAALSRADDGSLSPVGLVCLALAFTTIPRVVWQFYFFLRTDIYYLITTVLGCVDLQTTSRQLLANCLNRRLGRSDRLVDEITWHPRDRQVASWYAPLLVVGYAASVVMLVLVALPLAWQFFGDAVDRAILGGASSPAEIVDAAGLLVLNGGQVVLAAVLALRERRRRKGAPT